MAYATINKPNTYFNTAIYTGNSSTQSITSVGFQPNLLWFKNRNSTEPNAVFDSVRPFQYALRTNANIAEYTNSETDDLASYDSNGFSLNGNGGTLNFSGNTYVAWNWLGSNTTTNNTSGTISSTVCANTTSGFSIVSYTGTGANATVGHGLGVAPDMIICKSRTQAQNWAVYHSSLGNTKAIFLDGTGAASTSSSYWNNTSPTSTVFTVGNSGDVNYNAGTQISYCFSSIKGYSKFGSYVGNGSTNGTFVYTGFKPAFVLCRAANSVVDWHLFDNKRLGYNASQYVLKPNTSGAEFIQSSILIDFVSNGFKLRGVDSAMNGSGETIIYMAFAENPLVGTNNIPTTAR